MRKIKAFNEEGSKFTVFWWSKFLFVEKVTNLSLCLGVLGNFDKYMVYDLELEVFPFLLEAIEEIE